MRPKLSNPPVTAEIVAPPEVKAIFKHSCYSCHSNETKLPWFDQMVPAYWIVSSDVRRARAHLNFSGRGFHTTLSRGKSYHPSSTLLTIHWEPSPAMSRPSRMRGIMLRVSIQRDPFWPSSLGVSRMTLGGSVERYPEVSDPSSSLKCKPLPIVGRLTCTPCIAAHR
jgi:hypothetical protein